MKNNKKMDLVLEIFGYSIVILLIAAFVFGLLAFISFMTKFITWETARTSIIILGIIGMVVIIFQEFGGKEE